MRTTTSGVRGMRSHRVGHRRQVEVVGAQPGDAQAATDADRRLGERVGLGEHRRRRVVEPEVVHRRDDLAVLDQDTQSWWIVDWKTNRIDSRQAAWLKEIYEPQLSAYRAALSAITNSPVRAAIFSTVTGQWMEYDDAVLDARWAKLAGSPEAIEEALCL